ncbi:MAG: MoaD/ThiS family protein [Firmicutes bacterium]|nr:MoaD/ThiS family protein [Bacillota bacterium]
MIITVKLMPPYRKKGDPGEHPLTLASEELNIEQLAGYLSANHRELFGYTLIDERGLLTAEFIVNGKHVALDQQLKDGDIVTVIPYICGG